MLSAMQQQLTASKGVQHMAPASQGLRSGVVPSEATQAGTNMSTGPQHGLQSQADRGLISSASQEQAALTNKVMIGEKIRETLKRIKPNLQAVHEDMLPRNAAHASMSAEVTDAARFVLIDMW